MARLTFARIAWFFLACVFLLAWLAMLPGCTVDRDGLGSALVRRGETDVLPDVTADAGLTSDGSLVDEPGVDVHDTTIVPTVTVDAGQESTGDTDGGVDLTPVDTGLLTPPADAGNSMPPSECPIIESRSVSPCSASATVALCRYYYTPGMATLLEGCKAEGYLCVKVCP